MDVIRLSVVMLGETWCVKVQDRLGTRFVGAADEKAPMLSLALAMAQDAFTNGDTAFLQTAGDEQHAA